MANGSNNRLRRKSPGDENLFDNHQNNNEQQPVKLGSFLSDKSRHRAESALKNRKVHHGKVNAGRTFRKERKSSILNSLDKFLDDDDTDDTMSLRSSFSSGLGSEASEKPLVRKSLPPRVESSLEGNNDGEDDDGEPRRRYQRRGSVTRYSLKDLKEDLKEAEDEDTGMARRHSCHGEHKKKKTTKPKLKPSSHHGESSRNGLQRKEGVAAAPKPRPKLSKGMNPSIDSSMRSIDERPLPMRETSMRSLRPSEDDESIFSNHATPSTIDSRPLPMKMGDSMSSFQSFASDSEHGNVDENGFLHGGNGGGRPPLLRGGSSSKKTRSSTATVSSFDNTDDEDDNDDDDNSNSIVNHQHQQRHHQRQFPPRPQKKNIPSLSGLANLPSSSSRSDDHLQDDRSVTSGSTIGGGGGEGRQRMRRRGSVTKFSLDEAAANAMVAAEHDNNHHHENHLPPRPRPAAPRQGSARKSLGCMLNKVPAASGSSSRHNDEDLQDDRSISSGMSEGRQRYRRRGSVTKYSLETNNSNQYGDDDDEEEDNRSVVSEQLPPRPVPTRRRVSNTRPPPQKTKSLGRMPLARGSHQPQKSKSLGGKSLGSMLSSLPSTKRTPSNEDDDCCDRSINSEGILGGGRQRYRRRGSVTKFSLDDDAASACTNPAA